MKSNQIRDLVQLLLLGLDCGKARMLQDIEVPIFGPLVAALMGLCRYASTTSAAIKNLECHIDNRA